MIFIPCASVYRISLNQLAYYLCSRQITLEVNHGFCFFGRYRAVLCIDDGARRWMRQVGSTEMSWLLVVSAVVAIGLFIYLIAALINPEDFS